MSFDNNKIKNFFYSSDGLLAVSSNNYLFNKYKKLEFVFKSNNKNLIQTNIKKINFDLLFIFYITVICGNLNLASKYLSMTQPSVSLSLQKIEKEIGCILFKQSNSKRALQLTTSGLIVFNTIQRLFQITSDCLDFNESTSKGFISEFNKFTTTNKKFLYKNFFSIFSYNALFLIKVRSYKPQLILNTTHFVPRFEDLSKLFVIQKKIFFNKNFICPYKDFNTVLRSKLNPDYDNLISKNHLTSFIDKNGLLEITTFGAFNLCLEMEISNFFCWVE